MNNACILAVSSNYFTATIGVQYLVKVKASNVFAAV